MPRRYSSQGRRSHASQCLPSLYCALIYISLLRWCLAKLQVSHDDFFDISLLADDMLMPIFDIIPQQIIIYDFAACRLFTIPRSQLHRQRLTTPKPRPTLPVECYDASATTTGYDTARRIAHIACHAGINISPRRRAVIAMLFQHIISRR